MILRDAYKLAITIREQLAPFCERIEVAGSIRRARELVNDIDLVAQVRDATAFRARLVARTEIIREGEAFTSVRLKDGTQLDIFFAHGETRDLVDATPTNWGSVLLCRTGSKEHNVYICQRAHELGLKWETMRGIVVVDESPGRKPGQLIASASEGDIMAALNLEFIPPAMRER
jgi:DNA polymerase (family X)